MALAPGTKLGHYEIRSKVGEGGMGEVYLAQDTKLTRKVALKILPAEVASDRIRMSRFLQEARAASALNHPNIITVHEIDESDSAHFIVTELIEGKTLRERLSKAPLTVSEALEVATQVASALATAHQHGIIHRDIKPENIMVREDGLVKVLDFGLAKLTEPPAALSGPDSAEDPTLLQLRTQAGMIVGTLAYMSPEQARGEEIDARTDIWSFGCLLYEMISGQRPFKAPTDADTLANVIHEEPAPIHSLRSDTPGELERISNRTLRKDKNERYQTAADLLTELKDLQKRLEAKAELNAGEGRTEIIHPQAIANTARTVSRPGDGNRGVRVFALVAMAAFAILGFSLVAYYYLSAHKPSIGSVAVLPFENGTGDGELDYLSDGLSESLIDKLSQLPQLKVIARTSSFKYRGPNIDVNEIANRLGVRAIVTGKVTRLGDTLNVRVEMVDAPENRQIWSELYTSKATDLLSLQQEIAHVASDKLRLRLTGTQEQQLAKSGTQNANAYESVLRGRFYRNKGGADNLKKAHDYFQQATAADPAYALAYVELANSLRAIAGRSDMDPKEGIPKAAAALKKALELDDNLAEAHAAAGQARINAWDWVGAEQQFRRAIDLNPNLGVARAGLARYLSVMLRHDAAISEIKRARELDPLSLPLSATVGDIYIAARRHDDAIKALQTALELDPNFDSAYIQLGYAYAAKRMYREAIAAYEKAVQLGAGFNTQIYLAAAYAGAGERDRARSMLRQFEAGKEYVSPAEMAVLYIALGERERALVSLEKAYEERDLQLKYLTTEPAYDPIANEPRFRELVRKVGLPIS